MPPYFTIILTILIAVASLVNGDSLPDKSLFDDLPIDKFIHVIMYFTWTFTFIYEWGLYRRFGNKKGMIKEKITRFMENIRDLDLNIELPIIAFVLALFLGLVMELSQYFLGQGRSFENMDIIANIIGAMLGTLTILGINKLKTNNG